MKTVNSRAGQWGELHRVESGDSEHRIVGQSSASRKQELIGRLGRRDKLTNRTVVQSIMQWQSRREMDYLLFVFLSLSDHNS